MASAYEQNASEQARQHGNELYKSGKPVEGILCFVDPGQDSAVILKGFSAIEHYRKAAQLGPSEYAPLANLAAASFEIGDYKTSVLNATSALDLLRGKGSNEASKQRLALRLAKAHMLLRDLDGAKQALALASASDELTRIQDSLAATTNALLDAKRARRHRRRVILDEPRYKPMLHSVSEYHPIGHDTPMSLFDSSLLDTGRDQISFLLGGIGDARNLFATLIHVADQAIRKNSRTQFHFTITDITAMAIARNIVMFLLLDELAESIAGGDSKSSKLVTALCYVYIAPVMPPDIYQTMQECISKGIDALEGRQALPAYLEVAPANRDAILTGLRSWQDETLDRYPTRRVRDLVIQEKKLNKQQLADMGGPGDKAEFYPRGLKMEASFYTSTGILLPSPANGLPSTKEASLAFAAFKRDGTINETLLKSVDRHWKTNVTWIDIEWERRTGDVPYMGHDPFDLGSRLPSSGKGANPDGQVFDFVGAWVLRIGRAFKTLDRSFKIEAVTGDINCHLEQARYGVAGYGAEGQDSSGKQETPDSPLTYDRIHLSNIPDYVGGTLTVYMHAGAVMFSGREPYVTWACLRNPPAFKTWKDFDNEYLALNEPVDIRRTFSMWSDNKGYPETPSLFMPSPYVSEYRRTRRTTSAPRPFGELMTRSALETWLFRVFLKLSMPYPRENHDYTLIFSPLNLSTFYRLLVHLHAVGYPGHWLSDVLTSILSGSIDTNARPPRSDPLKISETKEAFPRLEQSVAPFTAEMRTLGAIWQPFFDFGVLSDRLPALNSLGRYKAKFEKASLRDGEVATFILVFLNTSSMQPSLAQDLRSYLLADEKGKKGKQAVAIRQRGLHVCTTWDWDLASETASFWLEDRVMKDMRQGSWAVGIWRSDDWRCQCEPRPLGVVTQEADARWH